MVLRTDLAAVPARLAAVRRGARLAALTTMTLGAVALIGWTAGLPLLASVLPGHIEMKANAAIGMLLAGAALWTCVGPDRRGLRWSGPASFAVLILGAFTFAEMLAGIDTGIGILLFEDPGAHRLGRVPGQMSPFTAASFVLAGLAGLLACHGAATQLVQALAMVMLVLSLFSLSAYGFLMGATTVNTGITPLGLNTALCTFALALGWLAVTPDRGLARVLVGEGLGGELARRAMLPALLTPVLLSYLAQLAAGWGQWPVGVTIAAMSVATGVSVAALVWWSSGLLTRIERERQRARQLQESSLTDELTHVGNRRAFDQAIEALLARRAQGGTPLCLVMIDLDRFKAYNDTFGHQAGDEALRLTGVLLLAALRPGDVAARYGGEEFAVLLPGVDLERACLVAERLCSDFRTARWPSAPLTASFGVAEAGRGETVRSLVSRADAALYAAKTGGRDRVETAPPYSGSGE